MPSLSSKVRPYGIVSYAEGTSGMSVSQAVTALAALSLLSPALSGLLSAAAVARADKSGAVLDGAGYVAWRDCAHQVVLAGHVCRREVGFGFLGFGRPGRRGGSGCLRGVCASYG